MSCRCRRPRTAAVALPCASPLAAAPRSERPSSLAPADRGVHAAAAIRAGVRPRLQLTPAGFSCDLACSGERLIEQVAHVGMREHVRVDAVELDIGVAVEHAAGTQLLPRERLVEASD